MAYSLFEWDKDYGTGGNLGWDYYYKMASAGLVYEDDNENYQFTDSFLELFPSEQERQEILETLNNEKEGNGNSQGSQC